MPQVTCFKPAPRLMMNKFPCGRSLRDDSKRERVMPQGNLFQTGTALDDKQVPLRDDSKRERVMPQATPAGQLVSNRHCA